MPLPPAAPLAPFLGPAAAKAAAVAMEYYLPSASLAAILIKIAWHNTPEWIRQDVAFSRRRGQQQPGNNSNNNTEKLSSVIVKIQAWLEEAATHVQTPVPHLWAALLLYWQLSCQLQRQQGQLLDNTTATTTTTASIDQDNNNASIIQQQQQNEPDFIQLQNMLQLATWAYYLEDQDWLQEQLDNNFQYKLLDTYCPDRPGLVGYYIAEQQQQQQQQQQHDNKSSSNNKLLISIRGTTSLEELLTDACGKSVSYHEELDHRHYHHHHHSSNNNSNNNSDVDDHALQLHVLQQQLQHPCIEVRARQQDRILVQEEMIEIVSGHERILEHHQQEEVTLAYCDGCLQHDDNLTKEQRQKQLQQMLEDHASSSHVRCHQGILVAAQRLIQQIDGILQEKVLSNDNDDDDDQSFQLILTGHSLGAATASLVAMLLRSKYPQLLLQPDKIKVFSFAPPPVLDHDSAIAAAAYTTSVVHQSDLIARCSVANLRVFLEFLRIFSQTVLIEGEMAPTNPKSTAALVRRLAKGDKGKPLWTRQQLQQAMSDAERTVELRHPNHLYVPGKLYFLSYNKSMNEATSSLDEEVENQHDNTSDTTAESKDVANPRDKLNTNVEYSCEEMDVTAATLRTIEMNGYRMLGDHTITAYQAAIDALARKRSDLISEKL